MDFKLCPMLYNLRHVLRIRPIEPADSLRQGTNWHKCLELLTSPDGGRDAMIEHLNQAYATCPPSIELSDWEVERTVLLYSALGWQWHWQNDGIETVAREIPFNRQINNVYSRRGKIDRIIRHNGQLMLGEYKSTSRPIDPGSMYWNRLTLDSQITLYLIEARHAQLAGELEAYGIFASDPLISGVLYDVWKKPLIRPKKLTQAESKKFADTSEYMNEHFNIKVGPDDPDKPELGKRITVNDVDAEVTPGSKEGTFAIRETPEMFGARLLAGITTDPSSFFARKEISRTDAELERWDKEYTNMARLINICQQRNLWFHNEHHCDSKYRCEYVPICLYGADISEGKTPDGFKRLEQ
jgi:hypothetical protein